MGVYMKIVKKVYDNDFWDWLELWFIYREMLGIESYVWLYLG